MLHPLGHDVGPKSPLFPSNPHLVPGGGGWIGVNIDSCIISFKALHIQAPSYISEFLNIYQPSRSLTSSSLKYLSVPKCNTVSYGHRAFSAASAKLWNSLPYYLRFTENTSTFKTSLKTFLFKRTFNLH